MYIHDIIYYEGFPFMKGGANRGPHHPMDDHFKIKNLWRLGKSPTLKNIPSGKLTLTNWDITRFNGSIHYFYGPCELAMFVVYQRVSPINALEKHRNTSYIDILVGGFNPSEKY